MTTAFPFLPRSRGTARALVGLLAVLPLTMAMHSTDQASSEPDSPQHHVVALTNQGRAASGCAPLAIDPALTQAAQAHAADMAAGSYMSHTSRDGRTPSDRIRAAGAPSTRHLAENIAAGQRTPEEVVADWMSSTGHRKNILDCTLRWIGIGVSGTPAQPYWVQDFAG